MTTSADRSLRNGVVGAVVLALVAVGCGTGGGRLSVRDYVRRAGDVCRDANAVLARIAVPDLSAARAAPRAMRRAVRVERRAVHELRGLHPPGRLADLHQRWVALLEQGADEMERAAIDAQRGHVVDAAEHRANARLLWARAGTLVASEGMDSCGGPRFTTA